MMDADGLGDLEEPDQLEPVEALGTGLVAVDLRETCADGWVGRDEPVDVSEPEEPSHRVHHRDHRRVDEAATAEVADVELDVCSLDAEEWVKSVVFAPGEPSTKLIGVQDAGVTGVPS
nr:hypothetical protein [Marmoricola sp. URHB0036]